MPTCIVCLSGDAPYKAPSLLTPQQQAENAAWAASFRGPNGETIWHTGHCPHLDLPGYLCAEHQALTPEQLRSAIVTARAQRIYRLSTDENGVTTWVPDDGSPPPIPDLYPKFTLKGHDFGSWGCGYTTYTCQLCKATYCPGGALGPSTPLGDCPGVEGPAC